MMLNVKSIIQPQVEKTTNRKTNTNHFLLNQWMDFQTWWVIKQLIKSYLHISKTQLTKLSEIQKYSNQTPLYQTKSTNMTYLYFHTAYSVTTKSKTTSACKLRLQATLLFHSTTWTGQECGTRKAMDRLRNTYTRLRINSVVNKTVSGLGNHFLTKEYVKLVMCWSIFVNWFIKIMVIIKMMFIIRI